MQYGVADGSANTIRPTTVTYLDGRVITYDYGASGSMADNLSRIAAIVDDDAGSTHLADYEYLGLGTFVVTDYTQPDIKYTLIGTTGGNDPDTGDIYRGLDRFGRIKDSYWYDYGSSTDVDRIKYGYDRNGNRLWRENTVAESLGKHFDELYSYDNIDRLQDMARGSLDSQHSTLNPQLFHQDWSLDATRNWRNFREDDDGNGTWDLNQQRTNNRVNEITDIGETTGPPWITPAYDPAGNMTTIPKPADPTNSFTATYDAWNRLVEIVEGGDTVAKFAYDGAKRRTVKKAYESGSLDETRHLFYTEPSRWQVVEERLDSESAPNRQFIWGLRYIDDILLRDRDTDNNGTLDERLYGMQDANWNVTSIADSAETIKERYAYTAYGVIKFMDGSFGDRSSSSHDWQTTYAGCRRDATIGCYIVRHRIFDCWLGNWLSRDPLRYAEGQNAYVYCGARPLNALDPRGLVGGTGQNWQQHCPPAPSPCAGFDSAQLFQAHPKFRIIFDCAVSQNCIKPWRFFCKADCKQGQEVGYRPPAGWCRAYIYVCASQLNQPTLGVTLREEAYHTLTICEGGKKLGNAIGILDGMLIAAGLSSELRKCGHCAGREILAKACATGGTVPLNHLISQGFASCDNCDPIFITSSSSGYLTSLLGQQFVLWWEQGHPTQDCNDIDKSCGTK